MAIVREIAKKGLKLGSTAATRVLLDGAEASHVYAPDGTLVFAMHAYEDLTAMGLTAEQARARRDDGDHGEGWVLWHDTADSSKPTLLTLGSHDAPGGGVASAGYRAATCEEAGRHELSCTCPGCGWKRRYEVGSALGHDWGPWSYGEWVVDKAATCVSAGSRHRDKGRACKRDASHTQSGTDSEAVPIDPAAHLWGPWSVHDHGAWVTDTAATCVSAGSQSRTVTYVQSCLNGCGSSQLDRVTESAAIPATGHDFSPSWTHDASGHWRACANGCGTKGGYAAHSNSTREVERVEPTSERAGGYYTETYCAVCGRVASRVRTELPATGPALPSGGAGLAWEHSVSRDDSGYSLSGAVPAFAVEFDSGSAVTPGTEGNPTMFVVFLGAEAGADDAMFCGGPIQGLKVGYPSFAFANGESWSYTSPPRMAASVTMADGSEYLAHGYVAVVADRGRWYMWLIAMMAGDDIGEHSIWSVKEVSWEAFELTGLRSPYYG